MNGFKTDDESSSSYQSVRENPHLSNASHNYSTKPSSSPRFDKGPQSQFNQVSNQPSMLSDLAAAVRSTSKDGQVMPGHRLRQKASSMF